MIKNINVLGIYGGASLNSVELALINTDGIDVYEIKKTATIPYPEYLAQEIRKVIGKRYPDFEECHNDPNILKISDLVSDFYAEIVNDFCSPEDFDEIGIDGLTVYNHPEQKCSFQIEKGNTLSKILGKRVITHFHKADLLSGGQASPLSAAFFDTLSKNSERPILFININAITSLIYLGVSGELIGFDCAPGIAMIEDWTFRHANMQTDYNGKLAITGKIHEQVLEALLKHKILTKEPPKSLDILCFNDKREHLEGLSLEDGSATVTALISQAIKNAVNNFLPEHPTHIYICGEGEKNPSLVRFLKHDFTDYQISCFSDCYTEYQNSGAINVAFNTARRIYALPITFPTTTGVEAPMMGGEIYDET